MTERPYQASNRKDIRAAEKAQVMTSTISREVIAGLMSLPNGRHWVYDRLADAFVFTDPFSPDAATLAYNTGMRAMGMALFNDIILYAPDNFVLMLKEAHERAIILDRIRTSADRTDPDHYGDHGQPHNYDTSGRWIGDGEEPDRPAH